MLHCFEKRTGYMRPLPRTDGWNGNELLLAGRCFFARLSGMPSIPPPERWTLYALFVGILEIVKSFQEIRTKLPTSALAEGEGMRGRG